MKLYFELKKKDRSCLDCKYCKNPNKTTINQATYEANWHCSKLQVFLTFYELHVIKDHCRKFRFKRAKRYPKQI